MQTSLPNARAAKVYESGNNCLHAMKRSILCMRRQMLVRADLSYIFCYLFVQINCVGVILMCKYKHVQTTKESQQLLGVASIFSQPVFKRVGDNELASSTYKKQVEATKSQ